MKCFGSQFVFLQGHPEYDANSLAREYRRDMDRYMRGETEREPLGQEAISAPKQKRNSERWSARTRGSLPDADQGYLDH